MYDKTLSVIVEQYGLIGVGIVIMIIIICGLITLLVKNQKQIEKCTEDCAKERRYMFDKYTELQKENQIRQQKTEEVMRDLATVVADAAAFMKGRRGD